MDKVPVVAVPYETWKEAMSAAEWVADLWQCNPIVRRENSGFCVVVPDGVEVYLEEAQRESGDDFFCFDPQDYDHLIYDPECDPAFRYWVKSGGPYDRPTEEEHFIAEQLEGDFSTSQFRMRFPQFPQK